LAKGTLGLPGLDAQVTPSIQAVEPALFYAFAVLTCVSAWAVVATANIVRMSVYLLLTLGGAAGLYFVMNAEFLAAIQLIVYAGGTLILIVFGVMLTSKNPFMQLKPRPSEVFAGGLIAFCIGALLLVAMAGTDLPQAETRVVGYDVDVIGRALLTTYLVPFEVAAVLLLIVMIAAAYMARVRASD